MRVLLFLFVILTQCAWDFPGWETSYPIKPAAINYPGTSISTNQTLTAAQTGQTLVFNNCGPNNPTCSSTLAANGTQFTLPTAVKGLTYTVIGDVAKWFYIKPQTTDIINFSTATTGQRISNSGSAAIGDSIELICQTSGQWSVKNRIGTWAVGPGQ